MVEDIINSGDARMHCLNFMFLDLIIQKKHKVDLTGLLKANGQIKIMNVNG